MPQLTIYLNESVAVRARQAAKAAGIPVSRWIAERIEEKTTDAWPEEVLRLQGIWKDDDFPSAEQIRASHPRDRKRERL